MNKPEFWLRGPLNEVPALLQPVAHALLQAREEITELMAHFPEALLWEMPAGLMRNVAYAHWLNYLINR
jgi:hypothetical protein